MYTRPRLRDAAPLDVPYEGCGLAACSLPPRVGRTSGFEEGGSKGGTTDVWASDDERPAAGVGRESVKRGAEAARMRPGSAQATGARYGGEDKAIHVMVKVHTPSRTRTPTLKWCVYSPTSAPLSLVISLWSAFLIVAASRSSPPRQCTRASSSLLHLLDPVSPNRVHQYARRSPLALAPPSGSR
jgi:hypothetical protein